MSSRQLQQQQQVTVTPFGGSQSVQTTQSSPSFEYAEFLNLFGIFLTVSMCLSFLVISGYVLKYLKVFQCKIRTILKKASMIDESQRLENAKKESKQLRDMRSHIERQLEGFKKQTSFLKYVQAYFHKYSTLSFLTSICTWRTFQLEILRPHTLFYILQLVTSLCIDWILSVFFTSVLESIYSKDQGGETTSSSVTLFIQYYAPQSESKAIIGFSLCIVVLSVLINMIIIDRIFSKIFLMNLKQAFNLNHKNNEKCVSFGEQHIQAEDAVPMAKVNRDQIPILHSLMKGGSKEQGRGSLEISLENNSSIPQATQIIESTRNMLQDDEEAAAANDGKTSQGREASPFLYIENLEHDTDHDLIVSDQDQTNRHIISRFAALFIAITLCSAISCYLNFYFTKQLTLASFFMLLCSYFGDLIVARPFMIVLVSIFRYIFSREPQTQSSQSLKSRVQNLGLTEDDDHLRAASRFNMTEIGTSLSDGGQTTRTLIDDCKDLKLVVKQSDLFDVPVKKQFILEREQLFAYNLLLLNSVQQGYGSRAQTIVKQFRTQKSHILNKRMLYAVLNPLFTSATLDRIQVFDDESLKEEVPAAEYISKHVSVKGEKQQQYFTLRMSSSSSQQVEDEKHHHRILDVKKHQSLTKGRKPFYNIIKQNNQSMDASLRSDDPRKVRGSSIGKDSAFQFVNPTDEPKIIEALEYTIEEVRQLDEIDQDLMAMQKKDIHESIDDQVKVIKLRRSKQQIEKAALVRKGKIEVLDYNERERLSEIGEDLEQLELEQLVLKGADTLKPEQAQRLQELRLKQLNRHRRKLNFKNQVQLTYDEALTLKELIPLFKVSLTPLEQFRLREQLKRHNLFTQKEQDHALLQEMRLKLKQTVPNLQLQKKEIQVMEKLMSKHQLQLPDDEWQAFRELQKRHGLLSKEEKHLDMLKDLRVKLGDSSNGMTKSETVKLLHLKDKYKIQFNEKETANILVLRQRYGILSQKEKDVQEFTSLMAKLKSNPDLISPVDLKRLTSLRDVLKNYLEITEEDDHQIRLAQTRLQDLIVIRGMNSNQSSAVNGDPVVFKSIGDLMRDQGRLTDERSGGIPSDEVTMQMDVRAPYFKDDLTNYSKARSHRKKKSNSLKKSNNALVQKGRVSPYYDQGDLVFSGAGNKYFSEKEDQADGAESDQHQRSSFVQGLLQAKPSAGGGQSGAVSNLGANMSNAMKSRLEALQEVYLQDLKPQSLNHSPLTQSQRLLSHQKGEVSPAFLEDISRRQSILKSQRSLNSPLERDKNKVDTRSSKHDHQQDGQLKPMSQQQHQLVVNYESEDGHQEVKSNGNTPLGQSNNFFLLNNLATTAQETPEVPMISNFQGPNTNFSMKQNLMISRFQEDDQDCEDQQLAVAKSVSRAWSEAQHLRSKPANHGRQHTFSMTRDTTGLDEESDVNDRHLLNSSPPPQYIINEEDSGYRQFGGLTTQIIPSYRQLKLKEITEALGSQGSSHSSMFTQQPFNFGLGTAGTNERVRSQDRTGRRPPQQPLQKSNSPQRPPRRQQTFGDMPASAQKEGSLTKSNRKPHSRNGSTSIRKGQGPLVLRSQSQNFVMNQDDYDQEQEEEDDVIEEHDSLSKTRIIKKKTIPTNKIKDYESPYAEYMLGKFENVKSQKNSDLSKNRRPDTQVENRLSEIRTAYIRDAKNKNVNRAQSPITSAMMMIHPRNYQQHDNSFGQQSTHNPSAVKDIKRDQTQELEISANWLINPFFGAGHQHLEDVKNI